MTAKPAFIVSATGTITMYWNKRAYNIDKSHVNYQAIKDILNQGKGYEQLDTLADVAETIRQKVAVVNTQQGVGEGVKVENGQVTYNGMEIHNAVVEKILQFARENFDFKPLVNFLNNLMLNPSFKCVESLYRFLEKWNHPITEDGCFVAYKYVNENYTDCYSGKFDNSPGKTVTMPRNQVEDDPAKTCSRGLHVCALHYLGGEDAGSHRKVVVVKVNPKDVVSVPIDYQDSKMRVCEYVVLEDYKRTAVKQEDLIARNPSQDTGRSDEDDDDDWDDEEEEDEECCDDCGDPIDDCTCCDEDEDDFDDEDDDEGSGEGRR